jgi:diaminohydroxyphosphoribosylaminopyrimidine deaminase / 5-amino-6-(5-phosphoribosylamino)uracil reductase
MKETHVINATPDERWMQHALELARRGVALTAPNPNVGCVIVSNSGLVIGEGWHEYERKDHAEIVALNAARAAGAALKNATAYITLEPCNHTGRTGPCTEALIAAGVRRVVIATVDPNPLVAGKGIAQLNSAGIQTTVGVCEAQARRLNQPFARWITSHRPFLNMKVAMTLDGRIAPSPGHHTPRQPYWITGEASRAAVQDLRWEADAVLTGVDTVIEDDPLLTDRSNRPRRRPLMRVILDSALRTPLDSKLIETANDDVVLFTLDVTNGAPSSAAIEKNNVVHKARIDELTARGIRVIELKPEAGRVSLTGVLDWLGSEGVLTLLTETGTRLNTALLVEDLVDQLQLFCAPQILGSDAVPAFKGLTPALKLENIEMERYGDDVGILSIIKDPWKQVP